tara:strand:- start:25043 stop:25903 length:861 start_codon:yes stop_codon:yes gene_type:complete
MTSKKHYIHVTLEAGILKVILKDPETKNAMRFEMAEQLSNTLNDFSKDSQSKVLMITGDKESFCSGANVRTMKANADSFISESTLDTDPWKQLEKSIKLNATEPQSDEIEIVRNITRHIFNLRKPSVAAVNGPAIGFGTGLALSCDIRLASTNAIFREAFVNVGLIPADGSCWYLPRMIGLTNSFLYQYTGEVITAKEAYRLGLVSKLTEPDTLMDEAVRLCQKLAEGPSYSMAIIKRLIQLSSDINFEESMEISGIAQGIAKKTNDHKEGVSAFLQKRKPSFNGD